MFKRFSLILSVCLLIVLFGCKFPKRAYSDAKALMDGGDYIAAEAAFKELGTYSDSPDMAKECRYRIAFSLMESSEFSFAENDFLSLGDYKDAPAQAQECRYLYASELFANDSLEEAAAIFGELGSYKDSAERKMECENESAYRKAASLYEAGKQAAGTNELYDAAELFKLVSPYKDSSALLAESCQTAADRLLDDPAVSLSACVNAFDFFGKVLSADEASSPSFHRLKRLALWLYVRESGTEQTDESGAVCRVLPLLKRSTTGTSDVVTADKLTLAAYEERALVLRREQSYASGGVSYLETLSLQFDSSDSPSVNVFATAYTDLGMFSAYISEEFRGSANLESFRSKADIFMLSFVQQARQISGKNTQTFDYAEEISIEKILNTIPEFFADFNEQFSLLTFPLSMEDMGFGLIEAAPVSQDGFSPAEMPDWARDLTPDLYIPSAEEGFTAEQPVLVICASGAVVRKGPDHSYEITKTIPLGETVHATAASQGWLYVRYGSSEYGWVDITQLFGDWMFAANINPALTGITKPKKFAAAPTVISTTDKANARLAPDTKSEQVGTYITGSQGVLIGTTELWYLMNFDGEYGWVHKNNFK